MFGDDVVRTDKANDDGSFVIYGLEEGKDYNVMLTTVDPDASRDVSRAAISGYGGWLNKVTASIGEQNNVGSIRVRPLGTIHGVVKRDGAADGYDTRVFIPGTSFSADTDEYGNYTISNVPQSYSPYKLRFTASGYSPKMVDVRLYSTNDNESPEITAPATTLYVNVGSLQGVAKLGSSKDSTGILIKIENSKMSMVGTTNYDGSFGIYDIKPGIYTVTASYPGYVSQTIYNTTILESRDTIIPVSIVLQKAAGTVSGTVAIEGKSDFSGIVVTVMGNGRSFSAETDSTGFYSVSVAEGNYDSVSFTGPSCIAQKWVSQQLALFADNNITLETVKLEFSHDWGSPEIINAATCSEAGSQRFTCKVCGEEIVRPIEKLAHTWVNNGSHDGQIEYVCSVCGEKKYTDDPNQEPGDDPVVDPNDDPVVDPTDDPVVDPVVDPNDDPEDDPSSGELIPITQRLVFDNTATPADFVTEDGTNVWERYYNVDMSSLSKEERQRMTFNVWWTNGGGVSQDIDWEALTPDTNTKIRMNNGCLTDDLSEYDSIIIHYKVSMPKAETTVHKLLLKPTVMVDTNATIVPINDFYETLQVDTSNAVSGKEYVLVIKPDKTEDGWIGLCTWSSVNTRYLDVANRAPTQKIETNEKNATVVYLGEIEQNRDFLITFPIHQSSEEPHHYADVYIREISDYEAVKMSESRVVIDGSEDTVVTIDVPANTLLQKSLIVVPEKGTEAKNLFITTECNYLNSDGSIGDYYGLGSVSNSLDGWSTDGTYSVFQKESLNGMSLFINNITSGKLRLTITIHKSDTPITPWTNKPESHTVTIIPNNGEEFYKLVVPTDEPYGDASFKAPAAPTRAGYSFVQWARQGHTYQPGDTVTFGFDDTMVAVWRYTGNYETSPYFEVDGYGVLSLKTLDLPSEIEIPLVVDGKTVKSIGDEAFKDCKTVSVITIPKGIQEFGEGSFRNCDNLEKIVFTGTTEEWKAIEKPDYWLRDVRFKKLVCTDRTIILENLDSSTVIIDYNWIPDTKNYSVAFYFWWDNPLEDYGITVFYTTDGTEPTEKSQVYDEPFCVEEGSKVRCLSVLDYDEAISTTQEQIPLVPSFTRGPAGGWIVYDKGSYSEGWRYLEIAPYDLAVVDGKPTLDESDSKDVFVMGYSKDSNSGDVIICGTSREIGTGYENTQKLYEARGDAAYISSDSDQKTELYAARLVSLLEYNGYDDWFIPSREELECIRTAVGVYGIANLDEDYSWYWGSSEYDYGDGHIGFPAVTITVPYNTGSGADAKCEGRVRPMRRY